MIAKVLDRLAGVPLWCYLTAAAVILAVFLWRKNWPLSLLAGYCFFIVAAAILIRKPSPTMHYKLSLFWSYSSFRSVRMQIVENMIAFIPIGVLSGYLWKWRGIVFGFGFSCLIELTQLFSHLGLFEFDDILHNTVGTLVGCAAILIIRSILKKRRKDAV